MCKYNLCMDMIMRGYDLYVDVNKSFKCDVYTPFNDVCYKNCK